MRRGEGKRGEEMEKMEMGQLQMGREEGGVESPGLTVGQIRRYSVRQVRRLRRRKARL
jgi:hypothetical protein